MSAFRTFRWVGVCALVLAPWSLAGSPGIQDVPSEFRHVGTYELTKRLKVREGQSIEIAINPLSFEVYTDGVTIRCYVSKDGGFTTFEVYRRDGVAVSREGGLIEAVPGVQARSLVGDVLRQMTLTEDRMTISRFPALSDIVEITYAKRIERLPQAQ